MNMTHHSDSAHLVSGRNQVAYPITNESPTVNVTVPHESICGGLDETVGYIDVGNINEHVYNGVDGIITTNFSDDVIGFDPIEVLK